MDLADLEVLGVNVEHQLLHFGLAFILGYALGTMDNIVRLLRKPSIPEADTSSSTSFVSNIAKEQKQNFRRKVEIDDTKYVTDISTDSFVSGEKTLGIVSQTSDDITSAASKLAQLKKTKG